MPKFSSHYLIKIILEAEPTDKLLFFHLLLIQLLVILIAYFSASLFLSYFLLFDPIIVLLTRQILELRLLVYLSATSRIQKQLVCLRFDINFILLLFDLQS